MNAKYWIHKLELLIHPEGGYNREVFRMKKIVMALSCVMVSIFSFNCSMTQEQFEKSHWNEETQGSIPTFVETKIEELDLQTLPDSGAYYLYHESSYSENILTPEKKLRRLYVLGFKITMAWYRHSTGGCNKPGTTLVTKTMYPEYFLVRLPKVSELIEKYNFRLIDKPKSLPCPYNVSVYVTDYSNG